MSATVPRPTAVFKNSRRITIEAPISGRTQTSGQDEKDRNCKDAGHVEKGSPGADHISPVKYLTSLAKYRAEEDVNVNNNNLTQSGNDSCSDSVSTIRVVHSCRKEENLPTLKTEDLKSGQRTSNTSNNIICTQKDVEKPIAPNQIKPNDTDTERSPCDSSNNNRAIETRANDGCIVDNLVMEANQQGRHLGADIDSKEQTTLPDAHPQQTKVISEAIAAPQPEVTFSDPRQSQVFQMLTGVQHLRRDGAFSDITVRVQGVDFRCHSFVLAINSPYLHAMIKDTSTTSSGDVNPKPTLLAPNSEDVKVKSDNNSGDNSVTSKRKEHDNKKSNIHEEAHCSKGGNVDNHELVSPELEAVDSLARSKLSKEDDVITLKGVQADTFSKMLDFMYCRFEEVITEDNCLELLLAAERIQLPHLRRTCAAFVSDTLSARNVFQVMALCDAGYASLFEPRVTKRAHQVIRENFSELSSADEFLGLGRHVMIPLMADSMLHSRSEMEVLQALLRWVKARPEERCTDMTLMLQHVRFPLMSSRELEKLREVPILRQNSLAMALIEESRAYGNLDYNERMAWPRHNSISRCLFSTRDLILWTADRDKGLHFYSIIDGQHHKVTSFGQLTAPPQHSASVSSVTGAAATNTGTTSAAGNFCFDSTSSVCCYADKIFFTGGEFNTDMVWSVDTGSGEMKVHAKMPRGRKFHSMVASKGCVYCLGGQDKRGYTVLEDVDAYIINKDMWVKVGHLAVPAYNMSAVVSGGTIYLVGGVDHAGQPLRLIQCFIALRSGLYSAFKVEISNMPPSLLSARAVACGLDKSIYIVCGHGEVYQFEPDRQSLSHVTTFRNLSENPRVRFGLAYVGGCLVVIGGHQLSHVMQEPIRSVCLDIASKTEVRDYSPMLPGDIVNTCVAAKLSSNILRLFSE